LRGVATLHGCEVFVSGSARASGATLEAEGRRARYDHGYYDGDGGPPVQFWPAVSIMRFVSSLLISVDPTTHRSLSRYMIAIAYADTYDDDAARHS
jgi:hypothetical protein